MYQKQREAVQKAFDDFTIVNNTIMNHFGDANPALILGYLVAQEQFLSRNGKLDSYGYFYSPKDSLVAKLGLSIKKQDNSFNKLKQSGFIDIENKRIDNSTSLCRYRHIRINYPAIYNFVRGLKPSEETPFASNVSERFRDMEQILVAFCNKKGAQYRQSSNDEDMFRKAELFGHDASFLLPVLERQYKNSKLANRRLTAGYLLKPLTNKKIDEAEVVEDKPSGDYRHQTFIVV